MSHLIFTLLIILFFQGCDRKSPPPIIDLDTIYDEIPLFSSNDNPSNQFDYVINNSLYEFPDGTVSPISSILQNKNFYLYDNLDLVFTLDKLSNSHKQSSRLIQKESWKTSDTNGNYIISKTHCYKPKSIDSYVWIELHGLYKKDANTSIYYNYPLVSLVWYRNFNNEYDHIWAIMTKSSPSEFEPKIYEYIDLGTRPDYIFPAEIHVKNNILEIKIEHSTRSTQNVSYWENVPTYFQAGITINNYQDGGEAAVSFNELRYESNESNVSNVTHF